MLDAIAFQTRARTIDHLGREQIADCPTAISELWKNSYDAYARSVDLHVFDGISPVAALCDDGHGMSRAEFQEKWLVVGTESKAVKDEMLDDDRNGLPARERQGQKGIGRLSAAALGPLLLLITKRVSGPFVAAMVDWRLFENPFLFLSDVQIPVVEFLAKEELFPLIAQMSDRLMSNVWGDGVDLIRDGRLSDAWDRFDELNRSKEIPSVKSQIEHALIDLAFDERHLMRWPLWQGKADRGTVLLVGDISFDLEAQLEGATDSSDAQAAEQAKSRLFQTLSNFTDPFHGSQGDDDGSEGGIDFDYSVTAWQGELSRVILSRDRSFGWGNMVDLEHLVEGVVDRNGVFSGRVRAFGKWLEGPIVIPPRSAVPARVDSMVGSFGIRLGTYEVTPANSSHPPEIHSQIEAQAQKYAGFMVFRNGLRVMPYGREDNDFFEIEKRRTMHAGREFWSLRRLFGRVSLSRSDNPNLKDKAGREGLIDNKAAKVFRDLVEDILMVTARRFFGSSSEVRKELLPEVQATREKERADEARRKVRSRKRREFRKRLVDSQEPMAHLRDQLEVIAEAARLGELPSDEQELTRLRDQLQDFRQSRTEMSLGAAPANLGALEEAYLSYRASYARAGELIVQLTDSVSSAIALARPQSQRDAASSELSRNAAHIQHRLRRWSAEAKSILSSELARVSAFVEERNKSYHLEMLPLLDDLEQGRSSFQKVLATLETVRADQDRANSEFFDPYISTLRNLEESVDIESLVTFSLDEAERAKSDLDRLNALAQLGITVEIVGHEIEGLDTSISRSLGELPVVVKEMPVYRTLQSSHLALSHRLRFLSPLKLSGVIRKEWITGEALHNYCSEFLSGQIQSGAINFEVSESFLAVKVYEQAARLMPVFINLVNNAIYWVGQSASSGRRVLLDCVDGEVIVADDGPGIDPADLSSLFSLFFTRRTRGGRGVGLYLCRANLAAGGHTIRYIEAGSSKRLSGANFGIKFRDLSNA
jgi:signal transduction histidine kinase